MKEKIKAIFKDPFIVFTVLGARGFLNWIPDSIYLKILYRGTMGEKLNLKNPRTYNEKVQWLKLYDRNPVYTALVDKYEVKQYIKKTIGEEHIIPTLGIWNNFEEIDFEELPEQFVLKCTHDSGGVVICKDKAHFEIEAARKKLNKSLKKNYYWGRREWPYKNVKPRIIAEQYMADESGYELKDYKFFCFDGVAKAMFIASDRDNPLEETKFDFFDMDFEHLPIINGHPNATKTINKPVKFDEMRNLAELLSKGMPHVRVDLYDINGDIYFGELTFHHWSGMVPFEPKEWDDKFGDWIKLSQI